jgi:hypothetical protein
LHAEDRFTNLQDDVETRVWRGLAGRDTIVAREFFA